MNEEKKQKLIEALKAERARFAERGHDVKEHDIAIEYLLTGQTTFNAEEHELLDAVMNDFDCVCSDYEQFKLRRMKEGKGIFTKLKGFNNAVVLVVKEKTTIRDVKIKFNQAVKEKRPLITEDISKLF